MVWRFLIFLLILSLSNAFSQHSKTHGDPYAPANRINNLILYISYGRPQRPIFCLCVCERRSLYLSIMTDFTCFTLVAIWFLNGSFTILAIYLLTTEVDSSTLILLLNCCGLHVIHLFPRIDRTYFLSSAKRLSLLIVKPESQKFTKGPLSSQDATKMPISYSILKKAFLLLTYCFDKMFYFQGEWKIQYGI